jgi:hypothetical protein
MSSSQPERRRAGHRCRRRRRVPGRAGTRRAECLPARRPAARRRPPWLARRPSGFPVSSAPSGSRTGHARRGGDRSDTDPKLRPWHQPDLLDQLTHQMRPRVATPVRPPPSQRSAPSTPGSPSRLRLQDLTASMTAFTANGPARLSLQYLTTTRQASLHTTDRSVASPHRAFDAGLRPGPFPGQNASLLPGSLAVTRIGLPPASALSGDDELRSGHDRWTITSCSLGAPAAVLESVKE